MLAATFTFAFQNVVAKTVEKGVPPMQVVFVRSCISGCVTAFTTWRRAAECNAIVREADAETTGGGTRTAGQDLRDDASASFTIETLLGSRRFWRLCLLRGVAGSIAFSLAYVSLTYLTVGDSVAIFFLNPIFSSLMAIPALGEKPSVVQAVAIGGGLVGTLLIVKPPALFHALGAPLNDDDRRRDRPMDPVGVAVTLFSAFFCAVAMVSIRAVRAGSARSPRGVVSRLLHCAGFASVTSAWPLPPVWDRPRVGSADSHIADVVRGAALAQLRVLAPADADGVCALLSHGGVVGVVGVGDDGRTDGRVRGARGGGDMRRGAGAWRAQGACRAGGEGEAGDEQSQCRMKSLRFLRLRVRASTALLRRLVTAST